MQLAGTVSATSKKYFQYTQPGRRISQVEVYGYARRLRSDRFTLATGSDAWHRSFDENTSNDEPVVLVVPTSTFFSPFRGHLVLIW